MLRKTLTILSLIGLLISVTALVTSWWRIKYRGVVWYGSVWDSNASFTWFGSHSELNRGLSNPSGYSMGLTVRGYRGIRGVTSWWAYYVKRSPFSVRLPLMYPIAFFAVASIALLGPIGRYRRRKRKKLGLCLRCGYDLRASKDRCPECGIRRANY